ncbi:DUF930 domain-containing protein [Ancylobacter radicis]
MRWNASALPPRWPGGLDIGASLVFHLALLALALLAAIRPLSAPEAPAIETEVISAAEFAAATGRATLSDPAPSVVAPAPAPALPGAAAKPARAAPPPDMIRAERMLSDAALHEPRNRPLRRQLTTLADDEYVAQLCDFEAMEQIHRWRASLQPDRLVDYALSDPRWEDGAFVAQGGAFRSGRAWYEVAYRCELDAARRAVAGFAFRVGPPIPRSEWSALNLPAVH